MHELILEFPTPPNRANESGGWQIRAFEKQKYTKLCYPSIYKHIPKKPWQKITWSAHVQVARLNDADNLVSRLKWCLDALVTYNFIVDDSPKHCWPENFPTQEVTRIKKNFPRLVYLKIKVLA